MDVFPLGVIVKIPEPLTSPTCSTPMAFCSSQRVIVMLSVVLNGPTLVRQVNEVPTPSVDVERKLIAAASFIQLTCLFICRISSQRTTGVALI